MKPYKMHNLGTYMKLYKHYYASQQKLQSAFKEKSGKLLFNNCIFLKKSAAVVE